MKIYEQRNQKRNIQCGYCWHNGHNKRNCPAMKAHWEGNPQVHETFDPESVTGVDKTMFPSQYQSYGWGDDQAKRQFRSHWRYMQNRFATKTATKPKKRKKPKCGFCGSTAHNRRNCNKLKNFIYVLNETNKGYRAAYYDRFVEGMGMGAGALLSVRGGDGDAIALITSFPTDKIMFTNLLRTWNDFHTNAKATLNQQGNSFWVNLGADAFIADVYGGAADDLGVWLPMYSNWGRINKVISPAPNRPTKEWFMGQSPCFEWVVKKKGIDDLMTSLHPLIKEFYPHKNLKSKLGVKVYDTYYCR